MFPPAEVWSRRPIPSPRITLWAATPRLRGFAAEALRGLWFIISNMNVFLALEVIRKFKVSVFFPHCLKLKAKFEASQNLFSFFASCYVVRV